jgi:hypothetical protein
MKLHLGSELIKLYVDDTLCKLVSIGSAGNLPSYKLQVYWQAGISNVVVTRTGSWNPEAVCGRIRHNDIVYRGDVLTIEATPMEGYTIQPYNTDIQVNADTCQIILNTDQSPVGSTLPMYQAFVLPSGQTIAFSLDPQNQEEVTLEADLLGLKLLIQDGDLFYHWGTLTGMDLPYLDGHWMGSSPVYMHLYDLDTYDNQDYNDLSDGSSEAVYIAAHGTYLGTVRVGSQSFMTIPQTWYITDDVERY